MPAQSRQLAAIMFTDIVGYTALMGEDEQRAFELLKKNRAVQRPIIEKFNGRWLKEMGDGVLASFSTVSDAVYCAATIQKTCENEPDLKLRIGVHLGEVVFEGNDVFGDGVNIASRLEPLAPVGGILVSESVHRNLGNKKDIESTFILEEQLKNVKEPIKTYSVQVEGAEPIAIAEPSIPKQQASATFRNPKRIGLISLTVIAALVLAYFFYPRLNPDQTQLVQPEVIDKSIVVLPFTNLSSDPEQEYFSDGMMVEILNHLVKIEDLQVISRTTSMRYKGSTKSINEIANELGVSTVLDGSVRKDGNQVRINVQLIQGATDMHLWSESYDRQLNNIFEVQSDVAQQIAKVLQAEISPEVKLRIESQPTNNPEAYNLYLKAIQGPYSEEMAYLEKAIELDPNFASAYSAAGRHGLYQGGWGGPLSAQEAMDLALPYIEKALELNENDPVAFLALADLNLYFKWDFSEAEKNYQKALELIPSDPSIQFGSLDFLLASGQFETALERNKRANASGGEVYDKLALAQYFTGHREQALETIRNHLTNDYIGNSVHVAARVYLGLNMYSEVVELIENIDPSDPFLDAPRSLGLYAVGLYHIGKLDKTVEIINKLKKKSSESSVGSAAFYLATIYAQMGEIDLAFEWLEKGYEDREVEMYWIKVEPPFDPLRSDPRWQQILEKVGFPD